MENRYAWKTFIEGPPIWLFDPYKLRFDKLDFDEIAGDDGHITMAQQQKKIFTMNCCHKYFC